jgi:hypothetical protein
MLLHTSRRTMATEPAADSLYFYIADCEFKFPYACGALRCNGMVLVVDVEGDELKDWSERTQFLKLLHHACEGDFGAEYPLLDLIREACTAVLRKTVPQIQDQASFTLQRYYNPKLSSTRWLAMAKISQPSPP